MVSFNLKILFFIFVFLNCEYLRSEAQRNPDLKCYGCTGSPQDLTCAKDPTTVSGSRLYNCSNGWCTILRQEAIESPGEILSFFRGCEEKEPLILDDIISDAHYVTYIRSCRRTGCNTGDGLKSQGSGGNGQGNGSLNIFPAVNSVTTIHITTTSLISSISVLIFLMVSLF